MACQHCGIEIKKGKNCTACSALLQKAYRAGSYDLMMATISAARAAGISGSEMQAAMSDSLKAGSKRANEWLAEARDRWQKRLQAESERIARGPIAQPDEEELDAQGQQYEKEYGHLMGSPKLED